MQKIIPKNIRNTASTFDVRDQKDDSPDHNNTPLLLQAFSTNCSTQDKKDIVLLHYAHSNTIQNYSDNDVFLLEYDTNPLIIVKSEKNSFENAYSSKTYGETLHHWFTYFLKASIHPTKTRHTGLHSLEAHRTLVALLRT
jgi:hypothetical protein